MIAWLAAGCAGVFRSEAERCGEARQSLHGGYDALKAGLLDRAERIAQNGLMACPRSDYAYALLGQIQTRRGDFRAAIESYKQAIEISPYSAWAYDALGYVYKTSGQYDLAIEALGRAIWADPSYVLAHINLGDVFEIRREPEKAEREYREAIRKRPDQPTGYLWLGNLYRKQDAKLEEAVELFTKFIELQSAIEPRSPLLADARKRVAELRERKGKSLRQPAGSAKTRLLAGSGFFVDRRGYVLTNEHVVRGANRVVIFSGRDEVDATIVATDRENDLALLKISSGGPIGVLPLGYSDRVRRQESVLVLGYPVIVGAGSSDLVSTSGRIAAVRTHGARKVLQIDVSLNPGNSGGPLLNDRGEVIGVVQGKADVVKSLLEDQTIPEGVGWAIPISFAFPLLSSIPEFDFGAVGKKLKLLDLTELDALAAPAVVLVIAVLSSP